MLELTSDDSRRMLVATVGTPSSGTRHRLQVLSVGGLPSLPGGQGLEVRSYGASYGRWVADQQRSPDWVVRDEQDLGALGRGRLKRVRVDLPDGASFDQFVLELPPAVVVSAVSDANELLMIRRFRFIVDRWVWELPGGYVEEGEDPVGAARRELVEETGWTSDNVVHLVTFEPMVGAASAPNHVYLARDCVRTDSSIDVNEASEVRWIPLDDASSLVASGEIVGSASVVAIAQLRARGLG